MTRVLWLSRHEPQDEQVKELESKLGPGPVEIVQVSATINRAKEIVDLMKIHGCDEVVVVLPINLLADFIRIADKPPIRAVMNREVDANGNATFQHSHFERVVKVEVVTTPL